MREKHVVLQHAPNRKERLNFSQPSSPPFFTHVNNLFTKVLFVGLERVVLDLEDDLKENILSNI